MSNIPDVEKTVKIITQFISDKLIETGMSGYVIGLSGGIDSAVSAGLAVKAVGKDKVLGVLLPYRTSSASSVTDATRLVEKLGIDHRQVDISPMIDAYFPVIDNSNRLRAGNKMARERMSILFDIASETDRLVLGTGNRTEICLGYTTWYGDAACSINPVGELYKTDVRTIAAHLDIPQSIRDKAPSADLWSGQTDEDEIGVRYEQIDALLQHLVDDGIHSISALTKAGFDKTDIERVVSLLNKNAFKRALPEIASLGRKPVPSKIQLED